MAKTKEVVLSVLEEYRQALAANPQSAEAHADLGWGLYGADQWDEAAQEFNQALRLNANLVDAEYGLALSRKCAGAKPEAVAAFDQTIALLPQLEDKTRGKVLTRLARGHIHFIQTGEWNLSNVLGGEI